NRWNLLMNRKEKGSRPFVGHGPLQFRSPPFALLRAGLPPAPLSLLGGRGWGGGVLIYTSAFCRRGVALVMTVLSRLRATCKRRLMVPTGVSNSLAICFKDWPLM